MGNIIDAIKNKNLEEVKKLFIKDYLNTRYTYVDKKWYRWSTGSYSLLDVAIELNTSKEIIEFLVKKGCECKSHNPVSDKEIVRIFVENKVVFNPDSVTLTLDQVKYIFDSGCMKPSKEHILREILGNIDANKLEYLLEKYGKKITTDLSQIEKYPCLLKYWDYTEKNTNEILEKYCDNFDIVKLVYKHVPSGINIYDKIMEKFFKDDNYEILFHVLSKLKMIQETRNTWLLFSVKKGYVNSVKALLEKKADIDTLDEDGKTLLELAGNNAEMVAFLISQGARFKPIIDPKNLITAIQEQDIVKIKQLIKQGVKMGVKIESKSPLEYALETKNLEIVNIVSQAVLGKYKEEEDEEEGNTTASAPEKDLSRDNLPSLIQT